MPMLHLELTDAVAYNPTRTARDPRARSVLDATPLSECLPLNSSRTTSEHPQRCHQSPSLRLRLSNRRTYSKRHFPTTVYRLET